MIDLSKNVRVVDCINIITETDWARMEPQDLENEINYLVEVVKEEIEKALREGEKK